MSNLQANRTLSGSFAEVWVDGARIAELSQLTLTVKVQREKVQFGMDVDSKITGYAGEGTMTLKQVYTRFYEVLEQAKRGLDKRCTITTALKEGDKVQLVGFGSFEVKTRAERIGRNPATGAEIKIAASKVPTFKAGKALKDIVG